jgi:hypothetical protein
MTMQNSISAALASAFLGLGVLSGAALAKDVPPLPDGIVISAPDASVPANIAEFVGTWNGISGEETGSTAMIFVVTDVAANGDATAIYAWAAGPEVGFKGPVVAKIEGDMLTMPAIFGPGFLLTFEMQADGTLKFIYDAAGKEYPSVLRRTK